MKKYEKQQKLCEGLCIGESIPHHHEDHIAGKGENSSQHYNLVHKFIPVPQILKILATKAAVDKEWEKMEKISAWNLTKVKNKKEVIEEAWTSNIKKIILASLMDLMFETELEEKHQNTILWFCSVGDVVEDDCGFYAMSARMFPNNKKNKLECADIWIRTTLTQMA